MIKHKIGLIPAVLGFAFLVGCAAPTGTASGADPIEELRAGDYSGVLDEDGVVRELGSAVIGTEATTPLGDLPRDFSKDEAIAAGFFVTDHTTTHNQDAVDQFFADVAARRPTVLRTMTYTIEGDAILAEYRFDGDLFIVTQDNSRDQFGGADRGVSEMTFRYLVRDVSTNSDTGEERIWYVLSNTEDIYTTKDGERNYVDGLVVLPSPSMP